MKKFTSFLGAALIGCAVLLSSALTAVADQSELMDAGTIVSTNAASTNGTGAGFNIAKFDSACTNGSIFLSVKSNAGSGSSTNIATLVVLLHRSLDGSGDIYETASYCSVTNTFLATGSYTNMIASLPDALFTAGLPCLRATLRFNYDGIGGSTNALTVRRMTLLTKRAPK